MPYTVTCTLCSFTREMEALDDIFEFRDDHQATYGDEHVIEFELVQ